MNLKNKNLALFLTSGMSLRIWHEIGMFEREVELYKNLAKTFNKIYIISYGNETELNYQKKLAPNITILYKKFRFINFFYQFIIPVIYNKFLKKCHFLKTNQIYGSPAAIVSKLLHKKNKLIIRSGYVASLSAKMYKFNVIKRTYINLLEYFAYRICNAAFITSEFNSSYLKNKYKFLKNKLFVLNNSVRTDIFKPLNIEKKIDIGYVGRLNKDKNILSILEAVKESELKLCFIGQGEDRDKIMNFAKEKNINLTLIKKVNNYELPEYYNQFKIFAFPSLHEGNPKTLLEAMSCGLPVIGCDVVGVNNIIKHKKNGILTKTDADSIKNAITDLLSKKEKQNSIGQQARQLILNNYSHKIIYKKEIRIYETLN